VLHAAASGAVGRRPILSGIESAPSNPAPIRTARLSLALLLSINLLNYIDRSNLSAVEEHIRGELLKDNPNAMERMGSLGTAFLLSYMLTAPFFGWLADRVKRWAIIGIGVCVWSLATGACGLAKSFEMLLLCRVFIGVGEAAWGPTAPTIIADLYPVSKRGTVLAWFNIALSVGYALGYILGGHMASTRWGWPSAFFVVAPPGLVLGMICFFKKDLVRGQSDVAVRRKFRFADLKTLVRIPSFVYNNLGMTAMTFAVGGMAFWMPTYVHSYRMGGEVATQAGRDAHAHVNYVFGLILVGTGLAGTLVGGYLADWMRNHLSGLGVVGRWFGHGSYFSLSGVTMLLAFVPFWAMLHRPFPEAWIYIGIALFLIFINTGPTNTIIANVTPPSIRASAYAFNILIIHALGDAISPPLIGRVRDQTGGDMNRAFALVGLAIVLAGVFWILGARSLQRDTEAAPTRLA
jgi:MFS transporter, Spinster family, sphingosine-1-phosphate transporter